MIAPAMLPPAGLPGLDPAWSRLVTARDGDGVERTWHVLDSYAGRDQEPDLTVICVHGNPTWSYLWRGLLAGASTNVRVIAVDQLDMGFSERTGTIRRLAQRVDDLGCLIAALGVAGPVVTVAHDWGGPISLGWALHHRAELRGVVLLNTAVHQPQGSPAPGVIRLARLGPLLRLNTVSTPAFVRATTAMSWPPLPRAVSAAFAAPYRSAARREAVGTFVADIPLESDHPSARSLDAIADGIRDLDGTPVLLLWGPGDPVFSDRYLTDLLDRVPHADVHRYEGARHLVIEDDPAVVVDLLSWIDDLLIAQASHDPGAKAASQQPTLAADDRRLMGSALDRRRQVDPAGTALTEWRGGDGWRRVSWEHLAMTVDQLAGGLATRGIQRGDRVALLIRPGADLIAVIYACWRIGASVVVTDAGLGARGIHRALRGSGARHVIGIPAGIALVRATGVPGQRISTSELVTIAQAGRFATLPPPPGQEVEALVAFTSGSTGPAKGVVYRHRQVEETRDLLQSHYAITDADVLVAAFAPWAVLGPALGIACVLPDMDVTSPRTLSAAALADAVEVSRGTLLWASPAALTSVLEGSADLTVHQREAFGSLRLVLAAGAPVQVDLLRAMADLCPNAQARTPYGMTEALPVCDVTLEEIEAAGLGDGVLVGRPLPGVDVRVSALADDGRAVGPLSDEPGVLGEIVVRGAHIRDHYDRLWSTQRSSARDAGWHRTGDVGHLDEAGRLWIGGRLAHVVTTPEGPLAPVGVEQRVLGLDGVRAAACVGVGPVGTQQIVVVVVTDAYRTGLADLELTDRIRAVSGYPVAAVLEHRELPVDIRHNSKIDRTALAAWAGGRLAGRGKP